MPQKKERLKRSFSFQVLNFDISGTPSLSFALALQPFEYSEHPQKNPFGPFLRLNMPGSQTGHA
jgi:hypothetical protein